ncbi:A disintegrin and metalloproteinase with thrombospondin motifs 4 [Anolis carolinensis]|uniref:A disintegrin and metalloproteinase with thrombospondin motifs 4 n=1 Tax=Anolis carolinensis TaxID=28377 RepID=UPI0004624C64|nr:PREDICTED: LOW QUALITY PROTEIN: A disintegrin and metalloproteinase with thrombospondin motifs 4 [Anolis carolinensis]|eukprot:XP_008121172.1 PREDICTED: LOW QUALITY PROTEIN: A disintegrin and metalloproteinase with thrombospondin motifs 4 [Anolis carolinensis]
MCYSMFVLVLAACCNLAGAMDDWPRFGRYQEEIVFPERTNASIFDNSLDGAALADERLSFRFRAFGDDFALDLEKDGSFVTEGLMVQYLGTSGDGVNGLLEQGAYFTGTVNSDPESIAAIHYNGVSLLGVLQYQGAEYHVQPSNMAGETGAHVVRRKVLEKTDGPICGVGSPTQDDTPTLKAEERPRRAKRFASIPHFVETLVVADEEMVRFHGAGLKPYLLTIMAAAAKFFRHPSLRNPVSLVVTKMVVIGEAGDGLQVSSNAAETLRNFCAWQKGLNKASDKDPEHFDTAILFTRRDLCGRSSCGTLGMADVGTVCDPARSCSIVEDDGLQSAFTAAHEMGHVFNMLHDDDKHCRELNQQSKSRHMMASVMTPVDPNEMWSPCSGRFITDFLDNGHGSCLLDKPHEPLSLPAVFPGSSYDVDQQCQLSFGPDSRHCPNMQLPCASLWCTGRINGQFMCQTKYFPWADGTPCGEGKSCMSGQCISKVELKAYNIPTHGGWGRWGPWGACSRTCGGGVQYSTRECNKPVPRNGGKYCEGKRTQYRSCHVQDCPDGNALTYREQQCAAYNHRTDMFKDYPAPMDWVPRYSGVAQCDQCKLTCQSHALGYYYVLEPKVADGTPCSSESSSVCVQGRCIHAGCDRVIGSKKKFDKCMVCGGDNSACAKIYGSFTKPQYGYNDVVTIPVGATHILIRQSSGSSSASDGIYLALRRRDHSYALNGNYVLAPSEQDVHLHSGSVLRYSGATKAVETIVGRGPLKEPLTLQALVVTDQKTPRLKYTFFVPKAPKRLSDQWLKQKARILEVLRSRRGHK